MKVFAYARYSSDNQREESIDAQLRAIHDFAQREGYEIVHEYIDEARTATTDKRPGFQSMIADAKLGGVGAIIVHKLDRFSRDRYDSAFYKRELKRANVRLVSVLERLDDSPESVILESVLEGMAEYYSGNLRREVMKGMRETAYQCKHTGGIPPLGYVVNADRSYSIDQEEAESVRIIFSLYASGRGYSDIIAALRGRVTKTGGVFAKNSITSILRNEKYAGVFVFNRAATKTNGKRNNHASKSDEDVIRIPGGIPRIIDDDTWRRAQLRLSDSKHNASNRAKVVYLLSGLLYCEKCGSAFVGKTNPCGRAKQPYSYYMCGERDRKKNCDMPRLSASITEKSVVDLIAKLMALSDPDMDELLETILSQQLQEPEEIAKARASLAKVEKQIQSIVMAIRDGAYHQSLRDELQRLSEREVELKTFLEQSTVSYRLPTREEVTQFLHRAQNIKKQDREEQKRIIHDLVSRIDVHQDGSMSVTFGVLMVEAGRDNLYAKFTLLLAA